MINFAKIYKFFSRNRQIPLDKISYVRKRQRFELTHTIKFQFLYRNILYKNNLMYSPYTGQVSHIISYVYFFSNILRNEPPYNNKYYFFEFKYY